MAWSMGFQMVVCEVHCSEVIRLIAQSSSSFHIYEPIIRDIRRLLAQDWRCSVQHVYREGNQATNFLNKLGASFDGVEHLGDRPYVGLELILLVDVVEVLHLR